MKTTLNITQTDIERGEQDSMSHCPIARAALRKFRDAARVQVSDDILCVTSKRGKRVLFALPEEASAFVQDFDGGDYVQPFSFTVDIRTPIP